MPKTAAERLMMSAPASVRFFHMTFNPNVRPRIEIGGLDPFRGDNISSTDLYKFILTGRL